MLCKQCGYQIKEGAAFCQKCGARLSDQLEQIAAEQILNQQDSMEQPETEVVPEIVPVEPVLDTPVEKKPKKSRKRGWIIAAIVTGALAVLVAAGIFLGPHLFPKAYRSVEGWASKNFGSGDDYLKFVEENITTKAVDGAVYAYGKYLEALGSDTQQLSTVAQVTAQLNVGETVITLLEDSLKNETGEAMELDWLKSVSLSLDTNAKDKVGKVLMSLGMNNTQILSADLIMDMENGALYAAIFPLCEKYLKGSLVMDEQSRQILSALSSEEIKEILPSTETVAALVEKYSKLVYENLKDAEKTTETVTIGDVQQKVTVLQVQLDFDTIKQLVKSILSELEDDETIQKIIEDTAEYLEEEGYITDADQAYEAFQEAIQEAKSGLSEVKAEDNFDKLRIYLYINDSHKIVGMKWKFDSDAVSYITIRNGEKFAFKLDAEDLKIIGTGTNKDEVINGEYAVEVEGEKFFTIKLQDISCKDNLLNGKLVLTPTDALMKELDLDSTSSSIATLLNPELEITFATQTDSAEMQINLVSGENLLVGLTVTVKTKEASDVTVPAPDKVTPETEAEQWLNSWDLNRLYEKLIEAGVPEDWAQSFILGLLEGMQPAYETI